MKTNGVTGVLSTGTVFTADGDIEVRHLSVGETVFGYLGGGYVGAVKLKTKITHYVPRRQLMLMNVHKPVASTLTMSINTQVATFKTKSSAVAEFVNAFSLLPGYRVASLNEQKGSLTQAYISSVSNAVFMEHEPDLTVEIVELDFGTSFPFFYNKVLVVQR